jgi:glycolate oxidase iron-sulfur subunit
MSRAEGGSMASSGAGHGAACSPGQWLEQANELANRCVHCGFCNAVCPTYQLTGDEREGPRGRIHQVRMLAEERATAREIAPQLDHCLTCRACESVCPSGVPYHHIADLGRRALAEARVRPLLERWLRSALVWLLLNRRLFGLLVRVQRALRGFMPQALARLVPPLRAAAPSAASAAERGARTGVPDLPAPGPVVALLEGCVQPALMPAVDDTLAAIVEAGGGAVMRLRGAGCCGALPQHLDAHARARRIVELQVQLLEQALGEGADFITMTATGCAAFVRDWPEVLADDRVLQSRAVRVVERFLDPLEVLARLPEGHFTARQPTLRVALQAPCSLQHAGPGSELLETVLERAGVKLVTRGSGPCCGSAGAYSLLFPATARTLRDARLDRLLASGGDCIASANVGCIAHLQSGTTVPVMHWLELLSPVDSRA